MLLHTLIPNVRAIALNLKDCSYLADGVLLFFLQALELRVELPNKTDGRESGTAQSGPNRRDKACV